MGGGGHFILLLTLLLSGAWLFGLSPLFATLTKQTAFCTILAQTNHLESTLTCDPTSVDSKGLTKALTPLDATLTKNRGGGGP